MERQPIAIARGIERFTGDSNPSVAVGAERERDLPFYRGECRRAVDRPFQFQNLVHEGLELF